MTKAHADRSAASPGRPRDPRVDGSVLEATLRVLRREGYARMTVQTVAREAGVSAPTVYLRHRSKPELAIAAVAYARENQREQVLEDTRADLVAQLRVVRGARNELFGLSLIGSFLAEEAHHPELLEAFREQLVRPRRARMRATLARAAERGEIPQDADIDGAVHLLSGDYYARYVADVDFGSGWPETAVDMVLRGLGYRAAATG